MADVVHNAVKSGCQLELAAPSEPQGRCGRPGDGRAMSMIDGQASQQAKSPKTALHSGERRIKTFGFLAISLDLLDQLRQRLNSSHGEDCISNASVPDLDCDRVCGYQA